MKKSSNSTVSVTKSIERVGKDAAVLERSEDEDTISVHEFTTTPAEVGVSLGMTLNLGNYEAAKIEVSCKIPCYKEEAEQAYDYAFSFVKNRLQEQVNAVRKPKTSIKDNNPL